LDQAALWWRRAAEIHPDSAEAFCQLGLAEEAGYQYVAAEQDLGRALNLAPEDSTIKAHYQDFQRKLAAGSLHEAELPAP